MRRLDRLKEAGLGYLLLAPALLVFGVFTFYPFVKDFILAAHKTGPYPSSPSKYVGTSQFVNVVTSSSFLQSLKATGIFVGIAMPIGLFLGLALAVFANQKLRGSAVFQVIFSSTAITSVAVAAVIFETLLNPNNGLLQYFGLHNPPQASQSPGWAIYALGGVTAWQFMGLAFIIMLAGLQSLPEEVVEAARTDGAGTLRVFFRVIIPLMSPTIFFGVVIGTILGLQTFGVINIVMGGSPGSIAFTHTNVLPLNIYNELTEMTPNLGVAACLSLALFFITLLVTLAQFRILEKRVHYGT